MGWGPLPTLSKGGGGVWTQARSGTEGARGGTARDYMAGGRAWEGGRGTHVEHWPNEMRMADARAGAARPCCRAVAARKGLALFGVGTLGKKGHFVCVCEYTGEQRAAVRGRSKKEGVFGVRVCRSALPNEQSRRARKRGGRVWCVLRVL